MNFSSHKILKNSKEANSPLSARGETEVARVAGTSGDSAGHANWPGKVRKTTSNQCAKESVVRGSVLGCCRSQGGDTEEISVVGRLY